MPDGTVKAFAYLLNNEWYVSIGKTQNFIKEVTGGNLDLSTGLICNLSKQFSEQTKEERDEMFLKLVSAPVMHADFTFGRMNGSQTSVLICAAGDTVLYQGRPKKGDEGVAGSPLEFYDGILATAKAEYAYEPLSEYFKEGYNLYKRKAAQVMCFRSQDGVDWFCDGLSIIQSIKAAGKNLYESVTERFHTDLEV